MDEFLEANPDFRCVVDLVALPPTADELREKWGVVDSDLAGRCEEYVSVCGFPVSRGTLYWKCRLTGSGDRFAAMLALGQPPGIETTDTFWAGRKSWREVYGPDSTYVKDVEKRLRSQGIEIGDKEYMPELARHRGDKEAVFSRNNIRGEIKSLCQRRGWAVEGAVNVEHRGPDSDPLAPENCKPLADHIVARTMRDIVKANPDLKHKIKTPQGRRTLREQIIAKHGRQ